MRGTVAPVHNDISSKSLQRSGRYAGLTAIRLPFPWLRPTRLGLICRGQCEMRSYEKSRDRARRKGVREQMQHLAGGDLRLIECSVGILGTVSAADVPSHS